MASFNLIDKVKNIVIPKNDYMLARGLMMPDSASNSGSRKLMHSTQLNQLLNLKHGDVPYDLTGYEMIYGKHASSYKTTLGNKTVIGIIPKFSNIPTHHYFLFTLDVENCVIEVYERKIYEHITENYGYTYNNDFIDSLKVNDYIQSGSVIQKSSAFSKDDNRMSGRNLLTLYTSQEETMEDAIEISESASKKLSTALIRTVSIMINENDIPLNIYGDNNIYKICPDIGENISNSILCALRREKKEEALYSQSYARLREATISDEKYTTNGKVIDINIYCNDPVKLSESSHYDQLKRYNDETVRRSNDIVNLLNPYIEKGYTLDYNTQALYSKSKTILEGGQYYSEKVFSYIVLDIVVMEEINALKGDKITNRYGGKGIISKVVPDNEMPKTASGKTVDICLNMCGVYGRENAGQLFEISLSYISMKLIEYMRLNVLDVSEYIKMYLKFLEIVAPQQHEFTEEILSNMTDDEATEFISGICYNDDSLYVVREPMTETITIDKINELYKAFPWIKPEYMWMPIKDSKGNTKYIPSRRPLIYGYQYIYRLKQYAKEKFSVTSLSATNIRNENSKSKSSNNYKALYSRTPIRFGDMETGNLIHLGAELVVQMLMLYSTSPHARRLTEELLTGDAFNVDIKLDMDAKNRNVEILNVYLKTMGLKLSFDKIPKKTIQALEVDPLYFYKNPDELEQAFIPLNPNEKFDIEAEIKRIIKNEHEVQALEFIPMEFSSFNDDE